MSSAREGDQNPYRHRDGSPSGERGPSSYRDGQRPTAPPSYSVRSREPSPSRYRSRSEAPRQIDVNDFGDVATGLRVLSQSQTATQRQLAEYRAHGSAESESRLREYIDSRLNNLSTNAAPGVPPLVPRDLPSFKYTFSGEPSDVAKDFIGDLRHWQNYHHVQDSELMHLLPTLLRGRAKRWYNDLPPLITNNLQSTLQELSDSFGPQIAAKKYSDLVEERKQREGESVIAYATAMRELSMLANVNSRDAVGFFIRGLIPPLKRQMKHRTYNNITEAENDALNLEAEETEESTYALRADMSKMETVMAKLLEKVLPKEQLTPSLSNIAQGDTPASVAAELKGLRAEIASIKPLAQQQQQQQQQQYQPRGDNTQNYPQRNNNGPPRYNNNGRPQSPPRQPYNYNNNRGGRPNPPLPRKCGNCARFGHDDRDCTATPYCAYCRKEGHNRFNCSAIASRPQRDPRNIVCYNCERVGHYARDCPRIPSGNA